MAPNPITSSNYSPTAVEDAKIFAALNATISQNPPKPKPKRAGAWRAKKERNLKGRSR